MAAWYSNPSITGTMIMQLVFPNFTLLFYSLKKSLSRAWHFYADSGVVLPITLNGILLGPGSILNCALFTSLHYVLYYVIYIESYSEIFVLWILIFCGIRIRLWILVKIRVRTKCGAGLNSNKILSATECPIIYRKFVLHLLEYSANLSSCSTDLF